MVKCDWSAVKADYEEGGLSWRELAGKFSVSVPLIRYHANRDGWGGTPPSYGNRRVRPLVTAIKGSGADAAAVLIAGLGVVEKLIEELNTATDCADEIEAAIVEFTKDDMNGQRRGRMLAAVALPSRAQVAKNLVLAAKIVADANPVGKKEAATSAAEEIAAAGGRFAVGTAPRLVSSRT